MSQNTIDYRQLAVRAVNDPLLALYACCPNCGGDIGIHKPLARLVDHVYATGVKFCDFNGRNCTLEYDSREWAWTRYFALKGLKTRRVVAIEFDDSPIPFEIAA